MVKQIFEGGRTTLFAPDRFEQSSQLLRRKFIERSGPITTGVLLGSEIAEAPLAEIEATWDREIEKRVAAYDRGELETFSAESVFAEARRLAR